MPKFGRNLPTANAKSPTKGPKDTDFCQFIF